ncbi:MAG: hypothetical protein PHG82_05380 [Candidatus Gracilibacteria bacterium]|nr:hypothetical protein [Candidatus Gracilibacteria bacterium]
MSEKNKDLYKSPTEQINKMIDKKEISEKMDSLNKKSYDVQEKYEVLGKISNLSKKLGTKYDVKVAISPVEGAYFLQINGNKLNIEIKSHKELDKVIQAVEEGLKNRTDNSKKGKIKQITGLGDNRLSLNGDITGRSININDSILPLAFDSEILNTETIFNKDKVEEIFVFIMNIKGIKKEDWNIESSVCRKNTVTDKCKDELGLPSTISAENF